LTFDHPMANEAPAVAGRRSAWSSIRSDEYREDVAATVVEVYDQMMRRVIGPALRQLRFTGALREFRYGSRGQSGVVAWQKDGREVRRQILSFTANVNYWCGADRIGELMPVPARDTWWQITGGQPYEPAAESVITAVRRYALPAIQAGLKDPERPDADMRYSRAFGPGDPDGGGHPHPHGSRSQPEPVVRKLIASRMLPEPGQRREPQPVAWLVADPAELAAQHRVLVPEHQESGVLGRVTPGQHH
jgi:hypothetical protein